MHPMRHPNNKLCSIKEREIYKENKKFSAAWEGIDYMKL